MLFNFTLKPLASVQPWGELGNLNLHWFGLTDGEYWIEVGSDSLFEYSEQVRQFPDATRYCNYQVVRFDEDVLEMVPFILEPVPRALVPYISGESGRAWEAMGISWREGDHLHAERIWDLSKGSHFWAGSRRLDTGYLSPSTRILLWSDESEVHIEWDNSDELFDGVLAWSAICGAFSLPRVQFVAELKSFHARLMEQMAGRIEQVMAGALPSEVHIDLAQLQRDQEWHCQSMDKQLAGLESPTDWQAVREAIQEVERLTQG